MRCQYLSQSHGDKDIQQFTPCKIFAAYRQYSHMMDEITWGQGIENRAATILPPTCQVGLWIRYPCHQKRGRTKQEQVPYQKK